jgi:AcrR family transcriptional regulator
MLGNRQDEQPAGVVKDRRTARRDATKAEILDAAWALVREQGLGALSLRDLAARVGMRAPSLYQYFASKHAIYDAMFGQGMRDALEEVAVSDIPDRRDALQTVARRMFEFTTSDPARAQLLFQRTIPGFEPSPESYAPAVELYERTQALLVTHGITDPDAMDLWTALISGLTNQQLANDPGGTRWARLVDRSVDMFIEQTAPPSRAPITRSPNREPAHRG